MTQRTIQPGMTVSIPMEKTEGELSRTGGLAR